MSGYERSDASVPAINKSLVGLLVLIAVSLVSMWALFAVLARTDGGQEPATPMEARRVLPPAPRLQVSNSADIEKMRAREREALASYGWVDKGAGIVRLPVERAMELLAERKKAGK
jgi:hypothetical protein